MEKILFIGDCGNFKNTSNGVYAKNIQLFNRLKEVFVTLKHVNTNNWKKNPSVLLNVLRSIWQYRKKDIIISLNTYSSYKLIKIVKRLFPSIRLNYFVIGGILPNFISQLEMKQRECYSIVKWFMVESQEMKRKMELLGYKNVIHIPNFKKIAYIPEKSTETSVPFRFVFLSRIIPEKGCDLIMEATRRINKEIGEDKFLVHFYGKIDDSYESQFLKIINEIPNAEYKGFLNLADVSNYDVLASYSAMLFPTFWKGEGFPGILIDAMIAGTPVIASEWGYNTEIIENGTTGIIIKSKNVDELANAMNSFICNHSKVAEMTRHCRIQAMEYDTAKVLNKDLFAKILKKEIE
ncbi:glycosyltransferase family 4 protein [Prevotella copri]|jgi:glycosyltransferase involved in cell wall biosynthesis|uniref:Glycosyltransferase family 4 protein n=1 Tax=Segatella copri TaxID=165179 RepID=A0AAW5TX96_9BACT|nr:glycosyltransferase family 4 protein [Segatella copri]MBM0151784.1 glycosyltransferase family 4 protein [Segatella copri]MCW4099511.1 glycosyltransferase family 4 protein [Segatella copri]MCW4130649.1 glycosyltransferase family 4 protein [Segatella copri]MCW4161347.1 glycosyltransferase family 4 protein [Segatella copri]